MSFLIIGIYCFSIIKYIPLQQGLRPQEVYRPVTVQHIIKYIPLQQGLRRLVDTIRTELQRLLSIFHYNKD